MSLLEVILAITILAGTLAILGEIIRSGARAGRSTTQLSAAQLVCESMMAEITSGTVTPESTEGEQIDDNGDSWQYTVQVDQAGQEGMLAVMISVQESLGDQAADPISFTLVRWMIDPQVESDLEAAAAEADAAAESTDSGSTDSGSGGADSGTSAGGSSAGGSSSSGGSAPPTGGTKR